MPGAAGAARSTYLSNEEKQAVKSILLRVQYRDVDQAVAAAVHAALGCQRSGA